MNDIKLQYPIELYIKKSLLVLVSVICILLFMLGFFNLSLELPSNSQYVILLALIINIGGMIAVSVVFIVTIATLIKNQPSIILTPSSIELAMVFRKNYCFDWSEIQSIELKEKNDHFAKHWNMVITPKKTSDKPLVRALKHIHYKDMNINEKEVFAIIDQAFHGEIPTYQKVNIDLQENFVTPVHYWAFILMGGFFIMALFFGFLIL